MGLGPSGTPGDKGGVSSVPSGNPGTPAAPPPDITLPATMAASDQGFHVPTAAPSNANTP